jgi:hypothetical protein
MLAAYSQVDFREGYIITLNGDTINGYLNFNSDKSFKCEFKKTINGQYETYKPFDIIGYRYSNYKYYISKEITVKKSNEVHKQIIFTNTVKEHEYIDGVSYPESGYNKLKIFIEFLIKGKLNIYYYKDNQNNAHYFVEKDGDSIHELTIENISYFNNSIIYATQKKETYKGELTLYLNDYPSAFQQIKSTSLSHKDLIKLGKDYHNYICGDNSCIIYERPLKHKVINYGIYTGYGYSIYHLKQGKQNIDFVDRNVFRLGSRILFNNFNPVNDKLIFKIDLDFFKNNYTGTYNYLDTKHNVYLDYYNLNLNLMLSYNLTTKTNTPYFDFGMQSSFRFGTEYRDDSKLINLDVSEIANKEFGLVFGVGYDLRFSKYYNLFFEIKHFQMLSEFNTNLLIGYKF